MWDRGTVGRLGAGTEVATTGGSQRWTVVVAQIRTVNLGISLAIMPSMQCFVAEKAEKASFIWLCN